MGRRATNSDILNARVVALDPSRGLVNLAPYTATAITVSLTGTSTLAGLTGPGVISLAQIYDAVGTSIQVRVNIDGTDVLSLSTPAAAGIYPLIGSTNSTTGQLMFEELPFRSTFHVYASKPTGTATNATFQVAYRLVEL